MKHPRILPLALLLFIFASPCLAQQTVETLPAMQFKDIYDRTLDTTQMQNWMVIVAFGNIDNKDTPVNWMKNLRFAFPDRNNVFFVIMADTRKFRFAKLFAKGVIRDGYRDEINDLRRKAAERNMSLPDNIGDYLIMVPDWTGAYFKAFGIENDAERPHMFIIDGDGKIRGHFTDANSLDEMKANMKTIFDEQDAKKAAAQKLTFLGGDKTIWMKWIPIVASIFLIVK